MSQPLHWLFNASNHLFHKAMYESSPQSHH